MISSELPEIVDVCDRAYVMRTGRIGGELGRAELTEANILRLAMHEGATQTPVSAPSRSVERRARPLPAILPIGLLLVLGALVAVNGFASARNLANLGLQASILLMLAMPMTLIIMSEGLDLSAGAVLSLCSVVLAESLAGGHGMASALAASHRSRIGFRDRQRRDGLAARLASVRRHPGNARHRRRRLRSY